MNEKRPNSNTYWVHDKLLAGEYPGHWETQMAQQRVQAYVDVGISYFVDLTQPQELEPYEQWMAGKTAVSGLPLIHHRLPIRDMDVPTTAHMKAILDAIDTAIANHHNVYVHCWGGIGRTGTVIGCYLVRHGLSGQEAVRRLAERWQQVEKSNRWPTTPQTPAQMQMVLNWLETPR